MFREMRNDKSRFHYLWLQAVSQVPNKPLTLTCPVSKPFPTKKERQLKDKIIPNAHRLVIVGLSYKCSYIYVPKTANLPLIFAATLATF